MAVAILALPSCGEKPNNGTTKPTGPTKMTFEATTESIDGTDILWSAYDEILVQGKGSAEAKTLGVSSGSGKSTATFSAKMDVCDKYYAFYPAASAASTSDGLFTFELPRTRVGGASILECGQIYRAAVGTADSGFEFRNLFGFVELQLTGEGTVTSIKINTASNIAMSGTFGYDAEQQKLTSVNGENSIVAQLPNAITLSSTPQSVFVMLPEGRYTDMTLTLSGNKGQMLIANNDVVVTRSSVTRVSDLSVSEDYVNRDFLGNWRLVKFCDVAATVDLYLTLNEDDSFTLYQREFDYQLSIYSGIYDFNGRTSQISGTYSDGVAWAATYTIVMNGMDSMSWTNNTTNEVSVYERCELPNFGTEASATRSADVIVKRFL